MYLWRETWLHPVFRFLCWKCKQIIAHLIQYFVLQMQNVDCTVINQPGLVTFALYEDFSLFTCSPNPKCCVICTAGDIIY